MGGGVFTKCDVDSTIIIYNFTFLQNQLSRLNWKTNIHTKAKDGCVVLEESWVGGEAKRSPSRVSPGSPRACGGAAWKAAGQLPCGALSYRIMSPTSVS